MIYKIRACPVSLCAVVVFSLAAISAQATDVSGSISSNATWTAAGSPYVVVGDATLEPGVTLTIQPGVTVQFAQYRGLWVRGNLSAVGTSGGPITFTGTTESGGWWRFINVEQGGSATFDYCTLRYAGYWDSAGILKSGSGALSIRNCAIGNITGDGLRIASGYASFTSQNNTFSNCNYGVRLGISASFDDNTSDFAGNNVDLYADAGTISGETTWNLKKNYSLFVSGNITVNAGAALTVKPGTVVKFPQYAGIWVSGNLDAQGTAPAPIYFTDWRDDTVGGDANDDGNTTGPAAGWWRAIFVQEAGSATLAYCTIRYAGYWDYVGVLKSGSGDLTMTNCMVSNIGGHGLKVSNSTGFTTLQNSTFASNASSGLYMQSGPVTATGCGFNGNGNYGILQDVNDILLYANNSFTGNAWGGVGVNGGTMTISSAWTVAASPYVILGNVTLEAGATLTIGPGVTVQFVQYAGVWVKGNLSAAGTSVSPIAFTGTTETPGWWRMIHVQEPGSATFDHCTVRYAGYFEGACVLKNGSGALSMTNCAIGDITGDGLRIASGYASFTSQNNSFSNCNYGVKLGINTSFDDNTSDFAGNNVDVYADGGTVTGNVAWNLKKDYSLFVSGNIAMNAGAALTVKPGTVVKFAQYAGIWVSGNLESQGTSASPIYFTDWRDDTVGGDANDDGNGTAPAPGWWKAIFVQEAGSATLAYCTVRYAGCFDSVGVLKTGSGDLTMTNCAVSNVGGHGLKVSNSTGVTTLQNSTFASNAWSGLYMQSGPATATSCGFNANGNYGILQDVNDSLLYANNSFAGNASGGVAINGATMTISSAWTAAGSPYVVLGDVTLESGATLTIGPGVTVQFAQYTGLWIKGNLSAVGTSVSPITFTGTTETPGWWRALNIHEAGSATFDHCAISYAGWWENAGVLKSGSGALSIRNCAIGNITGDGLRIASGYASFTSQNNTFSNCNYGLRLGINASFDDNTSDFAGNNVDVYADAGAISGNVIWNLKKDYSLHVSGDVTVGGGAALTVKPGTVVKFPQYAGIWVSGNLDAQGTAGSPIYFTDWRDDTVGGDANGDGSDTAPSPGWWRMIHVQEPGSGTLAHCTVRYAGDWDSVGVLKTGSGDMTMTNCTMSNVAGDGLRIDGSTGQHGITGCSFTENNNGVLVRNQTSTITLSDSQIKSNTTYGVLNQGTIDVDARGCWWGDDTGPYHPVLNPDGTGNEVSDKVLFEPWKTSAPAVSSVQYGPAGQVTLAWASAAGKGYRIWQSPDLFAWSIRQEMVESQGEFTQWTDDAATAVRQRFYKIEHLP